MTPREKRLRDAFAAQRGVILARIGEAAQKLEHIKKHAASDPALNNESRFLAWRQKYENAVVELKAHDDATARKFEQRGISNA